MKGDTWGSPATTTAGNSSEELAQLDLDIEVYDFTTMSWIDYDPTPIIDPALYSSPANCNVLGAPQVDTFLWLVDLATGQLLGSDDDSGDGNFSRVAASLGTPTSGQGVAAVVAASTLAGTNPVTGPYRIRVDAPSGYAGTGPFTVSAGSGFYLRARGNPGDSIVMFHSVLPNLSPGLPLPLPFVEGLLLFDINGLAVVGPNGAVIPPSGVLSLGPIPVTASDIGATIYGQSIRLDANRLVLVMTNEDSIQVVP